jgi:hypothetical protein
MRRREVIGRTGKQNVNAPADTDLTLEGGGLFASAIAPARHSTGQGASPL